VATVDFSDECGTMMRRRLKMPFTEEDLSSTISDGTLRDRRGSAHALTPREGPAHRMRQASPEFSTGRAGCPIRQSITCGRGGTLVARISIFLARKTQDAISCENESKKR